MYEQCRSGMIRSVGECHCDEEPCNRVRTAASDILKHGKLYHNFKPCQSVVNIRCEGGADRVMVMVEDTNNILNRGGRDLDLEELFKVTCLSPRSPYATHAFQ